MTILGDYTVIIFGEGRHKVSMKKGDKFKPSLWLKYKYSYMHFPQWNIAPRSAVNYCQQTEFHT